MTAVDFNVSIYMKRILVIAALALSFSILPVTADMPTGKLNRDLTVGAKNDVNLKSGQTVQVLGKSGSKVVIMVTLADGSNGVFQVDAADVAITAAAPPPPPAPAPAAAPSPAPVAPPVPPSAPPTPAPSAAPTPSGPPSYPNDFVGGAEVHATTGTNAAGTASVVHLKGQTQSYIVSARHLLGPEGGFPKQTAAKDVPSVVQAIAIDSFSGGHHRYDVTGLAVPTERLKADGGMPTDDMAIYLNHDNSPQDQALPLADHLPAMGEPLWLIAHVRGGVPEGQVVQPGKVIRLQGDGWGVMQFDNDKIITAGASGAPVLNAAGEVVGVYSGHSNANGHVEGYFIPATMIAKVIQQAPPSP